MDRTSAHPVAIEPTTTTRRRKRRASSTTATSTAARVVRAVLTGIWLVGVPAFAGLYVDRTFGAPLGFIPLGADSPGLSVTSVAAVVAAVAVAVVLHRQRAIFLLAGVPALVAWIGYVGFSQHAWVGALAGLAAGGIAFGVRRQQGR